MSFLYSLAESWANMGDFMVWRCMFDHSGEASRSRILVFHSWKLELSKLGKVSFCLQEGCLDIHSTRRVRVNRKLED